MEKSFKIFLVVFGCVVLCISIAHIILGPAAIPGSIPVNATLDSEDRFFATLFGAFGVALLWCVRDIHNKTLFINFLAGTFLVGGLARLISMIVVGLPHPLFIFLTVLELIIPVYMVIAQRKIVATSRVRTDVEQSHG